VRGAPHLHRESSFGQGSDDCRPVVINCVAGRSETVEITSGSIDDVVGNQCSAPSESESFGLRKSENDLGDAD
jgi:hypothetical protein